MVKEILRIECAITNSNTGKNSVQSKLNVFSGEIIGIIGMNNAGKTELAQGICGAVPFRRVRMYLEEREVFISSIEMGRREGIYYFSQTSSLISEFSVWKNFQLNLKDKKVLINNVSAKKHCKEIIEMLGIKVDVSDRVEILSQKDKLLVEVAKAVYSEAKILVFDDILNTFPETVLEEFEILFRTLTSLHMGIILVDNSIRYLKRFCQRLFVMRGGRTVAILNRFEMDENDIISYMMGTMTVRKREEHYSETVKKDFPLLEFRNIAVEPALRGMSFYVFERELVGILNMNGSSGEIIWRILQGSIMSHEYAGRIFLRGVETSFSSTEHAVNQGIAVMQKSAPFFCNLSLEENILLPALKRESKMGVILNMKELKYRAHELMTEYIIGYRGIVIDEDDIMHDRVIRQKISLCRLLSTRPQLVVLKNPTQGMDMTSREIFLDDIRGLKEKDIAALIISSDINELLDLCKRILFVNKGVVEHSIENCEENKEMILSLYKQSLKMI